MGRSRGDRHGQLEEPFRLRLLEQKLDVGMARLVFRPGTSGNILEPLVDIALVPDAPAPVYAALAYEPIRLARTDEQVGEGAPTRGLDVHHAFDARARLSRQEVDDRFSGHHNCHR